MYKSENIEVRTYRSDLSTGDQGSRTVKGYAALYNSETELWKDVFEVIEPGAFRNALTNSDIVLLLNHDQNHVLGRMRAGTLKVWEDDTGLPIEGELPESRADVIESVKRGDLDQMSFAFTIKRHEIERRANGQVLYRILEVDKIYDVSIVTYPAYPETSVSLSSKRTLESALAEYNKKPAFTQDQYQTLIRLAELPIIY